MRVVILGGTGVLSTGITKACLEKGYEIIHFNRGMKSTKYPVQTIVGNRYNSEDLKKVLQIKPDVIIDMLCFDSKAANMAVEAFKGKVNQYIFCSTSCVYTPILGKMEITEDRETNPYTEYGKNKLAAEKVFLESNKSGYFHITIFRPSHVFDDNFTVNNLTMDGFYVFGRMIRGQDVILTEDGKRYFQLCHSDNVGLAFAEGCENASCYGEIYNIAGEERLTWNEIYRTECSLLNSKSKIIYLDADKVVENDKERLNFLDTYTRYDWIQAVNKLKVDMPGYEYKTSFYDGIKKAIESNYENIITNYNEDDLYEKILEKK
ncbi:MULTISPECIES: NAD-dependent epimerase/dehydratase family protein [Clostridium]|uniref:NAD-dependent epimerase/dehydratase family protein n=1 Tax=Clostridium cibarium TaxID=2762247 RepID=A0ABR8PS62_9CLOT|nr:MULTISPECIES: NAD-dependent epimerase/dehydratase family protein [Clostridium]MBD7910988.1 NAD-dependent epimerase/dehydratase family protein [Clostridium cibarium]